MLADMLVEDYVPALNKSIDYHTGLFCVFEAALFGKLSKSL